MRRLMLFVLGIAVVAPTHAGRDPFAFFCPDIVIPASYRAALDRGLPIVLVLKAEARELAAFAAIEVDGAVTAGRMTAWMRNVAEFRKGSDVLALRQFSSPPRIEDLETLLLDERDLRDIDACRPGKCRLKLSAAEIRTLQMAQADGEDRGAAVQRAFRRMVLQRVETFAETGHAGLDPYDDGRTPRSPAQAFQDVVNHSTFVLPHARTNAEPLSGSRPAATTGTEMLMYWSKERLGGHTLITATHLRIASPADIPGVEVLVVATQIFATHYFDASLGVTALIRDPATTRVYFTYFNRSDVDLLGGFWGGIARRIIEGRIEADAPGILRKAADRLSSGDPPASWDVPDDRSRR